MLREGERPARFGRPVLTVGLAVAAVVLVTLVATGTSVPLATEGSGGWHLDHRVTTEEPLDPDKAEPIGKDTQTSRLPGEGVLAVLSQVALVVFGLTAMVLIGRAVLRLSQRLQEPLELLPEEHWPAPEREMADAVEDGLTALRAGPVDEVIVACWVRLEDAAAAAGVARGMTETSAELASRVLTDLHAPAAAVDALLQRYRRARYSHHSLDESDRQVAVRSLEEIRAAVAGAHA
jgi:hypothetical protein